MLEIALASHRYALQLEPDNADALFNTAGVLTSIAEEIAKDAGHSDAQALNLLEEALDLQSKCLSFQEHLFAESLGQRQAMIDASRQPQPKPLEQTIAEAHSLDRDADQPEEQWVSIVEPITNETLIDTIEAQLATLTTLCSILCSSPGSSPASSLAWVEEYSSKLLDTKIPAYLEGATDRTQDLALVKANFYSALVEAGFRLGRLDAQTYKRERDAAFVAPELAMPSSPASLLANATSLIAFSSALGETILAVAPLSSMRWNALAAAIADLGKAAKLADTPAEDLVKSHILRGDASMLQYQLSKPPAAYQVAVSNAASLVKNAEIFYRNASKLAKDIDARNDAVLKESLVVLLQDKEKGAAKIQALATEQSPQWVMAQVDDMMAEGLFNEDDVGNLSLLSVQTTGFGHIACVNTTEIDVKRYQ
jgi:hypothetical protein